MKREPIAGRGDKGTGKGTGEGGAEAGKKGKGRLELAWEVDVPDLSDYGATEYNSAEMAVSGNTAAAAWNGDAVGYDLTTGEKLWQTEKNPECRDRSYVGGPQLVAKVECDLGRKHSLQLVEEDGGKGWEWKAPDGVRITRVFSVDPVVVGVMSGDAYEITDVMVLDDGGKLRSKISIPEKSHMFDCEGITQAGCFNTITPAPWRCRRAGCWVTSSHRRVRRAGSRRSTPGRGRPPPARSCPVSGGGHSAA
ncbi:hypothetical protein [Streptomyces sp. CNQ085]|uniref:hypothetical protein n=1 Tax=Streptomyces sp. CNQ085 TaxID=2886944 RepID=UPI001F507129|nr:hypothetical protein [Streptomyces sp. CNQ085]MCI0383993.1 hypothetical protein [Streptomyces sp. CNQ085]